MPILGLGTPEIIVILVILLLLFGGKKLPELARAIGNSFRELKNSVTGSDEKSKKTKHKE